MYVMATMVDNRLSFKCPTCSSPYSWRPGRQNTTEREFSVSCGCGVAFAVRNPAEILSLTPSAVPGKTPAETFQERFDGASEEPRNRMTVNLAAGPVHLDSSDSIRTAFSAGWIGVHDILHPAGVDTKPLTVAEYFERSGEGAILSKRKAERIPEVTHQSELPPITANPLALIGAGAMLLGFFLPWTQLFGLAATGYDLARLGSYGNFAWASPVGAALVLLLNLTQTGTRPLQVMAGLTPWLGLLYGLGKVGDNLFQMLSVGAYITLLGAALLVLVPAHADGPPHD
jgi:hypothetical protein